MKFVVDYWPEIAVGLMCGGFTLSKRGRTTILDFAEWWYDTIVDWFGKVIVVGSASVAVAIHVLWGGADLPARAHVGLATAVLTAVAVGLPLLQERSANQVADMAIGKLTHDFNRTLLPLSAAVKRITEVTGNEKQQAKGAAKTVALTAASSILGGPADVRANWYEVHGQIPSRRLVPAAQPHGSVGRSDVAKTEFEEGTQLADTIFARLDAGDVVYCESIDVEPPGLPIWIRSGLPS
jgi:hypothetical protein